MNQCHLHFLVDLLEASMFLSHQVNWIAFVANKQVYTQVQRNCADEAAKNDLSPIFQLQKPKKLTHRPSPQTDLSDDQIRTTL